MSAVTATELGYLDGVTSNVQTQIDKLGIKIVLTDITLNYASGTLLRGNHYFVEGAVAGAVATIINQTDTPINQVTSIAIGTRYGGADNRVDIYANGTGFVSGHVLRVFCMAYIQT